MIFSATEKMTRLYKLLIIMIMIFSMVKTELSLKLIKAKSQSILKDKPHTTNNLNLNKFHWPMHSLFTNPKVVNIHVSSYQFTRAFLIIFIRIFCIRHSLVGKITLSLLDVTRPLKNVSLEKEAPNDFRRFNISY